MPPPRLLRGIWGCVCAIGASCVICFCVTTGSGYSADESAWKFDRILNRGINLGDALEAPSEGAWGITLKSEYFEAVQEAGFRSVRIPVRWSAHAMAMPPYTIAPKFFERVDWAIHQALARSLSVVIDVHDYNELYDNPQSELPRLIALWDQIAVHYQEFPDTLFFELVNEPSGLLTDERWQIIWPELLATVRKSNPNRMVIIGPGSRNNIYDLQNLHLPSDDRRLIVTFHYYTPLHFTHQGASWVSGADQWKGITWRGTPGEREVLRSDFEKATAWAKANRRPLYLGEFGTNQAADMASRALWTRAVVHEAQLHKISWAYWDFCSDFGAYDPKVNSWRQPLLRALKPK